ncbi:integral membrane protein Cj0341c [Candidatus Symbiothrix dinenymphae]|nr:integral membrane protein Cj0341c [Candidatus Symbiothrix dinenymphae]
MDFIELGYLGLFIAAFIAATVVPFSSEVVFTALAFDGFNLWSCVLVATAGNWLGGMSCYYLGRVGRLDWIKKYTGVNKEKIDKIANKIQKHGDWLAFFSFLPAVGDAIAVAAGFFRCNIWIVCVSMLLGKFFRYVLWMYFNGLFI